jgi:hypothetical protein
LEPGILENRSGIRAVSDKKKATQQAEERLHFGIPPEVNDEAKSEM